MFGSKKNTTPRPLNDSGRSQVSESFALEGTLRTSGAIDISGLIKGPVYANDIIIKETGSIIGPVEADKIEIYGHLEGKILAKSGTLANVRSISGIILDEGEIFSIIVNNMDNSTKHIFNILSIVDNSNDCY